MNPGNLKRICSYLITKGRKPLISQKPGEKSVILLVFNPVVFLRRAGSKEFSSFIPDRVRLKEMINLAIIFGC